MKETNKQKQSTKQGNIYCLSNDDDKTVITIEIVIEVIIIIIIITQFLTAQQPKGQC
jgi:hypothetical protein